MKMNHVTAFLFALTIFAVSAQTQECPPTEIMLLIDQSENTLEAASSNTLTAPFDYLKDAVRQFLTYSPVANAPFFRIGANGYSGDSNPISIIPVGTSPRDALNYVDYRTMISGASWTYKGMETVQSSPVYSNNAVIVLTSLGSGNTARRSQLQTQVNRVRQLGWNAFIGIGCQGVLNIDREELRMVNDGREPSIVYDTFPVDPKSPKCFRNMTQALINIINNVLCLPVTTTTTQPTTTTTESTTTPSTTTTSTTTTTTSTTTTSTSTSTTPRPTFPTRPSTTRSTGICTECLIEGGYGFDFDPVSCNTYYQCIPGSAPIKRQCPSGTMWDGSQCNHLHKVGCALAVCDATRLNVNYHNGACCNKYFRCTSSGLVEGVCPAGQIFNQVTAVCETPLNDARNVCREQGMFYCDVDMNGPVGAADCAGYAPDPFGRPCYYQFHGYSLPVAPGTIWSQDTCSLIFTRGDFCYSSNVTDRDFPGEGTSGVCNAVFLSTFNGGSRAVWSERLNKELSVYTIMQEVMLANNALIFTQDMRDPFFYYYFFNNRDIRSNTAFRVQFALENPTIGTVYDILSNNYCSQCAWTISFTVSASASNRFVVTVNFLTVAGDLITTSAIIDVRSPSDLLEMIVVYGDVSVYGRVYAKDSSNIVYQTADFRGEGKPEGAEMATNRCGFQLGRGPNEKFIGRIDEFAVYENCQNIASVVR